MSQPKLVFMSGASGVMGHASFLEMYEHSPELSFSLLLRDSPKNRNMFKRYKADERVRIVWGDLLDYSTVKAAVDGCDVALHIGGMVSPKADYLPLRTVTTNMQGAKNVVRAIKEQADPDHIKTVYIGSVAQTGDRNEPTHWGRTGDPITSSIYDHYAISKSKSELIFAESGLKHWVSLRQSGILYPGILNNIDPIMLHVVLRGVLEWATVEDSATLMNNICKDDVPESFWGKFYNISSGASYRMTNYEFEDKLLYAIGMGHDATKKLFGPNWFITRNFHGQWYLDADKLEDILHFRHNVPVDDYFAGLKKNAPWFASVAFLGSNWIGKLGMMCIAYNKRFGTLSWIKNKNEKRMNAYFGSYEKWKALPTTWEETDISRPSEVPTYLDHGYDETKPIEELDIEDMKKAAEFRGGKCISIEMKKGDLYTPLKWKCAFGHEFTMTPNSVLKGGHWCSECEPVPWEYDKIAKVNPFFAQVWYSHHDKDENNYYDVSIFENYDEYIQARELFNDINEKEEHGEMLTKFLTQKKKQTNPMCMMSILVCIILIAVSALFVLSK